MKKYFVSIFVFANIILSQFSFAQSREKLIQLTPEIGDTIDLSERNYYNLFPVIKDFRYALIYSLNDTTSELKIYYLNKQGSLIDTVFINNANSLGNFRVYIRHVNQERLENFESNITITITKLDGNQFIGKLLSVQDSSIIVCPSSVLSVGTQTFLSTYIKLRADNVESVQLEFESWPRIYSGMRIGALLGCVSGLIVALTTNSSTNNTETSSVISEEGSDFTRGFTYTVIGGLIGVAVGAGVGWLTSADETIEINSASDIEQLKGYLVK